MSLRKRVKLRWTSLRKALPCSFGARMFVKPYSPSGGEASSSESSTAPTVTNKATATCETTSAPTQPLQTLLNTIATLQNATQAPPDVESVPPQTLPMANATSDELRLPLELILEIFRLALKSAIDDTFASSPSKKKSWPKFPSWTLLQRSGLQFVDKIGGKPDADRAYYPVLAGKLRAVSPRLRSHIKWFVEQDVKEARRSALAVMDCWLEHLDRNACTFYGDGDYGNSHMATGCWGCDALFRDTKMALKAVDDITEAR